MHRNAIASLSPRTTSFSLHTRQCRHASTSPHSSSSSPASTIRQHPSEAKSMKSFVKTIDQILKSPDGKPGEEWTHTPWLRGEEMRLKKKVKVAEKKAAAKPTISLSNNGPVQSMALEAFGAPDAMEQTEEPGFAPDTPLGSFVEMRRNDLVGQGIVVGSGFIAGQWKLTVLTENGESWLSLSHDIYFSIPSVCSADLAARCGTQPIAENTIQLNARVEVLRRMRTMLREVETAMIDLAKRVTKIYDTIRAKDPEEWAETSVTEVAKIFHRSPTAAEIFATHKLLLNDPLRFVAATTYQANQMVYLRPLADVQNLQMVQRWIREKNPALERFAVKAGEIMAVQKKLTEESRMEKPQRVPATHVWSSTDKTIIRFLTKALRPGRDVQSNPYTVGLATIVKRVYGNKRIEHIDSDAHQLLVDIGVFTPWHDLLMFDRNYGLDLEQSPVVLGQREQAILRAVNKSNSVVPTHPEEFHARDPLESVRHDWGDMPVYVVDDVNAEELDDGISIERIPSEPGNLWIHVHIADPASLIPPTNFLAQKASEQMESWYLVQKSYPLFPKCIVRHPTHGLSLGIRSSSGGADRVLTFSIKMDSATGSILDYTVRAGLVRNVQIVDYDSVDAALNMTSQTLFEYPFGNRLQRSIKSLTPETTEDMKMFYQVAATQRKLRLEKNWFHLDHTVGFIARADEGVPLERGGQVNKAHLHRGFPALRYHTQWTSINSEDGSRATVAEMMKLACRVASRFCLERNIPALRRVSNPMVPESEQAIQMFLDMRDRYGYIREQDVARYIIYRPVSHYKTSPEMHFGLGIPEGEGYIRVTSPLRRYGDLLAHWQIHQALLKPEGGKVSTPFDLQWMENFAATLTMKEHLVKTTSNRDNRFWKLAFIKRWLDMFGGGKNEHLLPKDLPSDPLEGLEGYMSTLPVTNKLTKQAQVAVRIPRLGMKEIAVNIPNGVRDGSYPGMTIPLRLRDIQLGIKPLMTLEYDNNRQ